MGHIGPICGAFCSTILVTFDDVNVTFDITGRGWCNARAVLGGFLGYSCQKKTSTERFDAW